MSAQTQPERYEIPKTLNEAGTMIAKLGFTLPSREDLLAIRNVCGTNQLGQALADALNGENLEESKSLLSSVLGAVAPSTRKRLESMGLPSPPTEVLARIGKEQGAQFSQQVREASAGTPKAEEARNFVALTLARYQEEFFDNMPLLSSREFEQPADARAQAAPPTPPAAPVVAIRTPAPSSQPKASAQVLNKDEDEDEDEDEYRSAHIYGGGFALCFNATQNKQGRPTISIDAAAEISGKERKYNWADKITVQLSMSELPMVYAVLMGKLDTFKGTGHGAANEKWFEMKNQPSKVFFSMFRKGTSPRGVPITAGNIYPAASLVMRQIRADSPHLSPQQIDAIIDRVAALADHGDKT